MKKFVECFVVRLLDDEIVYIYDMVTVSRYDIISRFHAHRYVPYSRYTMSVHLCDVVLIHIVWSQGRVEMFCTQSHSVTQT